VNTAFPAVASPPPPPPVVLVEPLGADDAAELGVAVLTESVRPIALESEVVVPCETMTITITAMPTAVPISPAVNTLIIGARTIPREDDNGPRIPPREGEYPNQGMLGATRFAEHEKEPMLDKRDIQTLMYCVRLAEAKGLWQQGTPARSPNELECKLAQLMGQSDAPRVSSAA
jgi:hypothetical protein